MNQRGFTLFELLVVLAIVGVLLALIPGFMLRSQPGLDVDVATRALADGLRQARSRAVLQNRDQLFALDVEARQFRLEEGRPPVQMDRAMELTFRTASAELLSDTIGQIRFFADGSSTGGRIGLSLDGRYREVEVDWLTGLVSVHRVAD